jgi:hypothetical protein
MGSAGGNGFGAARAVHELEERLGCLVLESNQVLLWSIMRETARLFRSAPGTSR